MKKMLFLLLSMCLVVVATNAQTSKPLNGLIREVKYMPDTLINADTSYVTFNAIGSNVESFQFVLNRLSGAIGTSGIVFLQASNDDINWITAQGTDTLTLANAAVNSKWWYPTKTTYVSYRAIVRTSTATGTARAYLVACRRPDEISK